MLRLLETWHVLFSVNCCLTTGHMKIHWHYDIITTQQAYFIYTVVKFFVHLNYSDFRVGNTVEDQMSSCLHCSYHSIDVHLLGF